MSWDYIPKKNALGYADPTADEAIARIERSRIGAQNRAAGEHFEKTIEASLVWYKLHDVAEIEKTPEPMKQLSRPDKRGRFRACYVKAAQPDFKGTIAGGRSVVFEAKHTISDKIEQKVVTKDQADRLNSHYRLGAVAFVLVGIGFEDFYRVPWKVWRDMKEIYGHKHMKRDELEPFRVQYIAGVLKLLEGVPLNWSKEGKT